MKIVMLNDNYDGEIKVWSRGQMFDVDDSRRDLYIVTTIGEQTYAISKDCDTVEFLKIIE